MVVVCCGLDPLVLLVLSLQVFESFSDEERSMYVRFAWGRSRLPHGAARWTSQHKLSNRGLGDNQLPIAHT